MTAIQRVSDHDAQHGVAEKFQSLVSGNSTVFVGVRTVRQGTFQDFGANIDSDALTEDGNIGVVGR